MEAAHYEQTELWGAENVLNAAHQRQKSAAVQQLLPSPPPLSVLDVGAGDGRVLRDLIDRGHRGRMVAAERSRAALLAAADDREVRAARVQATIGRLPFGNRAFSVVLCCEVLEHLPPDDFERARIELTRIAEDHIVVTVPNREKRSRSTVDCHVCGCRYSPERHLRSFSPEQLADLLPDFAVDQVIETGPRQPVYPRWARLFLERAHVLQRPGSPSCPQCGALYRYATPQHAPTGARPTDSGSVDASANGGGRRSYDLARRLVPKARHPYWLCARFRRVR